MMNELKMRKNNLILSHPNQITMVTVTYGSRCSLLTKVVDHAFAQGVGKIIVVNNGAEWDVADWANNNISRQIDVVTLQINKGSAEGFYVGIERAIKLGSDFILLMDDDNIPDKSCIINLIHCYQKLLSDVDLNKIAICALRYSTKMRLYANKAMARPDTFLSFHFYDLPGKIASRLRTRRRERVSLPSNDDIVALDMAPYGGLLFHSSVIQLIGLPKQEFVLYGDDGEFTYRLSQHGGFLGCCTKASVTDMDDSWNANKQHQSSFAVWLMGKNEVRSYYYARNQAWIDSHLIKRSNLIYLTNKYFYITVMFFLAFFWGRLNRLRLLLRAIREGEQGMLGVNGDYQLK
ncbi:MAG: glycosyltransferase [Acidithiobacillus sp.]|nr:glycosyltransferase [Acidithiobacillus sp.]